MCDCVCTEWIEEHSSAAAPLANYAPNHLETYRDPQVPPALPPVPAGVKRKFLFSQALHILHVVTAAFDYDSANISH